YTGGTIVNAAQVIVGNSSALGSGTLSLVTGTIQATNLSNVAVNNPVALFTSNVTVGGRSNLTFNNSVTVAGANTLTVNSTGTTTFVGQLSGGGALTVTTPAGVVPGPLVLANTNNTFTSGLTLGGAANVFPIVRAVGNGSLGGSQLAPLTLTTLTLDSGELLTGGSDLTFSNLVNFNAAAGGAVTFGGGNNITFTGLTSLTTATPGIVVNNPTTTFSNIISGAFGLNVAGNGTLLLTAPNTYTGATTIAGGIAAGLSGANLNSGRVVFSGLGASVNSSSF